MSNKINLGKRLQELRKEAKLTLTELSEQSGVSATHISEIERGRVSPTLMVLMSLSDALGKNVRYFLPEETEKRVMVTPEKERDEIASKGTSRMALSKGIAGADLQAYAIEVEPGGDIWPMTPGEGEVLTLITEGKGKVTLADKSFDVEPGDVVHFKADIPHEGKNVGKAKLKGFYVVSPPIIM